jgi:hypothetical protein
MIKVHDQTASHKILLLLTVEPMIVFLNMGRSLTRRNPENAKQSNRDSTLIQGLKKWGLQ